MPEDDHLDKETSVSVALTETGIEAKARSRFVSAADRFGGNLIELMNVAMEEHITPRRAKIDSKQQLIQAVTKAGLEHIAADPAYAKRAFEALLGQTIREQENKDAVLGKALEDLRENPPAQESAEQGPAELSEQFLDRMAFYAKDATTDELRERWGRVLASEVRHPGTFSPKVLRVVDELSASTAQLFERVCKSRLVIGIPICLSGELRLSETILLVTGGLIVDPGFVGQVIKWSLQTDKSGIELWFLEFEGRALAFPKSFKFQEVNGTGSPPLKVQDGSPCTPIYVLTDEGQAISSILPDPTPAAADAFAARIQADYPNMPLRKYRRDGGDWKQFN